MIAEEEYGWAWREDAPNEVLLLVHNDRAVLLAWCGRALEQEERNGTLRDHFDEGTSDMRWPAEDGLWICPGRIVYTCHETWDGKEYDAEFVEDGPNRRLSPQEWAWYLEEPLDPDVWPKNYREVYK